MPIKLPPVATITFTRTIKGKKHTRVAGESYTLPIKQARELIGAGFAKEAAAEAPPTPNVDDAAPQVEDAAPQTDDAPVAESRVGRLKSRDKVA